MVENYAHFTSLGRYLSMNIEELESMVAMYPYYIFPKIALHLKKGLVLDIENETDYANFLDYKKVQWYECHDRSTSIAKPTLDHSEAIEGVDEISHNLPEDISIEVHTIADSPSADKEEEAVEIDDQISDVLEGSDPQAFASWLDQFTSASSTADSDTSLNINSIESSIPEDKDIKSTSKNEESSFFQIDKLKFEEQVKDDKVLSQEAIYEDEELDVVIGSFVKDQLEKTVSKRKTPYEHTSFEVDEKSIDNETFVSETMALLYAEQGLNAKAIDLYKKLIIRIPEKSVFFANQIDKLK